MIIGDSLIMDGDNDMKMVELKQPGKSWNISRKNYSSHVATCSVKNNLVVRPYNFCSEIVRGGIIAYLNYSVMKLYAYVIARRPTNVKCHALFLYGFCNVI